MDSILWEIRKDIYERSISPCRRKLVERRKFETFSKMLSEAVSGKDFETMRKQLMKLQEYFEKEIQEAEKDELSKLKKEAYSKLKAAKDEDERQYWFNEYQRLKGESNDEK